MQEGRGQAVSKLDEALQELCEAGADYIEAEREGSGQGSWGRAMAWQVVKDKYSLCKEVDRG